MQLRIAIWWTNQSVPSTRSIMDNEKSYEQKKKFASPVWGLIVWSTLSIALYSIFDAFCVSWNDLMHTTSFPAAVLKRSLICPFVSVSPATYNRTQKRKLWKIYRTSLKTLKKMKIITFWLLRKRRKRKRKLLSENPETKNIKASIQLKLIQLLNSIFTKY